MEYSGKQSFLCGRFLSFYLLVELAVVLLICQKFNIIVKFSGLTWREELDELESPWKWSNSMQTRSVCFLADNWPQRSASLQVFPGCSHRTYHRCYQSLEFLHLLLGTVWILPLKGFWFGGTVRHTSSVMYIMVCLNTISAPTCTLWFAYGLNYLNEVMDKGIFWEIEASKFNG